jgi:NitT/TauT family transport system permease protein
VANSNALTAAQFPGSPSAPPLRARLRSLCDVSVCAQISPRAKTALGFILVALIGVGYVGLATARHADNPDDKVIPTIAQLVDGLVHSVMVDRSGAIPLLNDTLASLARFSLGVLASAVGGVGLGLFMGVFPLVEALFLRFLLFFGKIPPLALLPILFVLFGLGDETKVLLIFVGIAPGIALDTYLRTKALPSEQLVKALTLGASIPELIVRVVLPQIMPSALNIIRLNLQNAWLYLIAAETIAAANGLGYRIFVVRRYMAMDTIIPYVLWIALLAFAIDAALTWWIRRRYPWYQGG